MAKTKGKAQLRTEAVFAQGIEALKKLHPELAVNESDWGFCYAPYAWNNGNVQRVLGYSLDVSSGKSSVKGEEMKEVYLYRDELDKLKDKPNAFVFVLFGVDNAIAFLPLKPTESYRRTVHDKFALPVKGLNFLTTFIYDPN